MSNDEHLAVLRRGVAASFSSHQLCPEKHQRGRPRDDEDRQVQDIATLRVRQRLGKERV